MNSSVIDLTDSQGYDGPGSVTATESVIVDREEAFHEPSCSHLPSECTCSNVSWIWATHKHRVNESYQRSGKWMLFPNSGKVDEAWFKVVDLLADRKLGGCAKVAPVCRKQNNMHVICIYTSDHENVKEVFSVLHTLRNSGISSASSCTLNYKTDDATYGAVYATDHAAVSAGFAGTKAPGHKNFKVSKYTSVGFQGNKNVMMKLNNIGPDHLCSLVAEMPLEATPVEIDEYFQTLPATASEFAEEVLAATFESNHHMTDYYPVERDRSSSWSAYDYNSGSGSPKK